MFGRIGQHFTRTAGTVLGLAVFAMLMASCSRDQPMEPTRGSFTPQHLLAPANDNFADATVINTLPFTGSVDLSLATTEPGEPSPSCFSPAGPWSAWYAFTPSEAQWVSAALNNYNGVLAVYEGSSLANLNPVSCTSFAGELKLQLVGNVTYYFQVGGWESWSGSLDFNLVAIPSPPNDNFADATNISTLPFSDALDITAASLEPGEPMPSCAAGVTANTAWYAYTPSADGSVSADKDTWFSSVVAAYTGTSLANLTEVGCRGGGSLTFHAAAGTTYYFQVGGVYGWTGSLTFRLEVTPPPVASFWFNPSDPSVFDDVRFNDNSNDPGNAGFVSWKWLFGDGATSTESSPTHRYAADGNYTVQLTVTTTDGRTASTSQVLSVKTYDLAITKFSVPTAGSVGQTRSIVVGVNNKRYTAFVDVIVFKSTPGGFVEFARTWTYVPVRSANRTTDVAFSYTFTARDGEIGKVTFKAIAYFTNFRDALPGDNEAIAKPTKVNK
jgi:PKD repeat protein